MNTEVTIKEIPRMELAYVSTIGPQNLKNAFGILMRWATPHGLMHQETKMVIIYHDSFKATAANQVRLSASILLDKPVETTGEIGLTTLAPGKCIVGSFEIELEEFEKAWTGLFLWMNENGYKKAKSEPFEIYHNDFNQHPEGKAMVDFCIPIES